MEDQGYAGALDLAFGQELTLRYHLMMRDTFRSFHRPSKDDFDNLWRDGLIVLDANVILNLYRLPKNACNEFLSLLEKLKGRLWIPHQVALEFQIDRISVIQSRRKTLDEFLARLDTNFESILDVINKSEFEHQDVEIHVEDVISSINKSTESIRSGINQIIDTLQEVSLDDPLRDRIEKIFFECVGPAPESQRSLDDIYSEGAKRYGLEIPPGFKDAGKDNQRTFNGLNFQAKYGDLIAWKQIIAHASSSGTKSIIFVTDDKKEDWWNKFSGKTLGPRPELIQEISKEAAVEYFWMYSFKTFSEFANSALDGGLSTQSLSEIASVSNNVVSTVGTSSATSYAQGFSSSTQQYQTALGWATASADRVVQSDFQSAVYLKDEELCFATILALDGSGTDLVATNQILKIITSQDIRLYDRALFIFDVGMSETYGSIAHNISSDAHNFFSERDSEKIQIVFGRWITRAASFIPLIRIVNLRTIERC